MAKVVPYVDPLASFVGGVVADEPRAAVAGHRILERGGTAADAAATMFFTLTATYPVAASLSGSGYCVVYDAPSKRADLLDFRPTGPQAVLPGAARAMALLQSRYGKSRWEEVIAPGEQAARLGHPVSRAYARALAELGGDVAGVRSLAPLVRDRDGQVLAEGAQLQQTALGLTLTRLRTAGAGDLYNGVLARTFIADAAAAGIVVDPQQLRDYMPQWRQPKTLPYGRVTLLLPPSPGGEAFAQLWPALAGSPGVTLFSTTFGGGKPARDKIPGALAAVYAAAPPPVGRHGSTGFAAMDKNGQAVSCTVSQGRAFGTGRIGAATGIALALPAGAAADEGMFDVPLVIANLDNANSFVAAAATGGTPAAAALAQVMMELIGGERNAAQSVGMPRVFRTGGSPDLYVERGLEPAISQAYVSQGLALVEGASLGRVNLLSCDGLPRGPASCRFAQDRRGFGLAIGDNFADGVGGNDACIGGGQNCTPDDGASIGRNRK